MMLYTETPHSTNLTKIGYDYHTQTLEVWFRNGGVYRYSNVPASVWEDFQSANSVGKFFHNFVRGKYPTTKVA